MVVILTGRVPMGIGWEGSAIRVPPVAFLGGGAIHEGIEEFVAMDDK